MSKHSKPNNLLSIREGLFTFLKVVMGGDGVDLSLSWVRSEIFLKSRLGMKWFV
jgi:hypothetical protein